MQMSMYLLKPCVGRKFSQNLLAEKGGGRGGGVGIRMFRLEKF